MNLTVRIHDVEYTKEVAQGVTFSEEYNETLDSGAIRLTHIKQIANLRPYDDVYIYESAPENYEGDWYMDNVVRWRSGGELHDGDNGIPFYRHLLVDNYTESLINISEGIMSYNIDLMSETKRLEMIQLPNICVTQPLKISKRHSIWWLMNKYVNSYSPKYKKKGKTGWSYTQKYSLDPDLETIFSDSYSQDFSLQNPTLRDVLSSLMVTKDMIPYVKDDVIYAKDIGHTTGSFNMQAEKDSGRISTIAAQMTSADYCDGVRRQYSNALSSEGTCTFVEYLGFRNKDSALMSLENIRLELGHPIYRIKKCRMCYYKKGFIVESGKIAQSGYVLVKHDITPLIKTKEEYSLLSQDWRVFSDGAWSEKQIVTMKELAGYQLSTVYYSQGGTTIEGWGAKYTQTETSTEKLSTWDIEKTRIENILNWLDKYDTNGDVPNKEYSQFVDASTTAYMGALSYDTMFDAQYNDPDIKNQLTTPQKMKTIFFEIEYEGFYNGALIHSRDKGQDNIIQNDNSSGSLLLLEKDGTSQKAKVNRFANKTYSIKARLDGDNYNVNKLLQLGSSCNIGGDNNVIVYHREYSIYDNYILASYACIQDYVLKNFYTSVYAKYRINQLMSYGESVNRSENEKVILLMSKDKKYEDESSFFEINVGNKDVSIPYFLSAFRPVSELRNINKFMFVPYPDDSLGQLAAFIAKKTLVDGNAFSSGTALCFYVAMPDNISGGTYIDSWSSDYKRLVANPSEDEDYVVGSEQKWNSIVDDEETGEIANMLFSLGHYDNNDLLFSSSSNEVKKVYTYTQSLPRYLATAGSMIFNDTFSMSYKKRVDKDNKERIDMTFQIEPLSDSSDIVISRYLAQLSDLLVNDDVTKLAKDKTINKIISKTDVSTMTFFTTQGEQLDNGGYSPIRKQTPKYGFGIRADDKGLNITYEDGGWEKDTTKQINAVFAFGITGRVKQESALDKSFTGELSFAATSMYWKQYEQGSWTYTRLYLNGTGTAKRDSTEYELSQIVFQDDDGDSSNPAGFYFVETDNETFNKFNMTNNAVQMKPVANAFYPAYVLDSISKSSITSTLHRNMFVQYGSESIDSSIVDKIIPITIDENDTLTLPQGFVDNVNVSDVFNVSYVKTEEGESWPTILINIENDVKTKIEKGLIKSINYWYLDFDSAYKKGYAGNDYLYEYTPKESGYRFVFGVNVSGNDIKTQGERYYIPIYISKLINRDTRVYDEYGRVVDEVENLLDNVSPVPQYTSLAAPEIVSLGYNPYIDDETGEVVPNMYTAVAKIKNPNSEDVTLNVTLNIENQSGWETPQSSIVKLYAEEQAYLTWAINSGIEFTKMTAYFTRTFGADSPLTTMYKIGEDGKIFEADKVTILDILVGLGVDENDTTYHLLGISLANGYDADLIAKNVSYVVDDGQGGTYSASTSSTKLFSLRTTEIVSEQFSDFGGGYVKVSIDIYDGDTYISTITSEKHF